MQIIQEIGIKVDFYVFKHLLCELDLLDDFRN